MRRERDAVNDRGNPLGAYLTEDDHAVLFKAFEGANLVLFNSGRFIRATYGILLFPMSDNVLYRAKGNRCR